MLESGNSWTCTAHSVQRGPVPLRLRCNTISTSSLHLWHAMLYLDLPLLCYHGPPGLQRQDPQSVYRSNSFLSSAIVSSGLFTLCPIVRLSS